MRGFAKSKEIGSEFRYRDDIRMTHIIFLLSPLTHGAPLKLMSLHGSKCRVPGRPKQGYRYNSGYGGGERSRNRREPISSRDFCSKFILTSPKCRTKAYLQGTMIQKSITTQPTTPLGLSTSLMPSRVSPFGLGSRELAFVSLFLYYP